jgi:hypothetical protein
MTIALVLTAMTILNWISAETAAKLYLVVVVASYITVFMDVWKSRHERP